MRAFTPNQFNYADIHPSFMPYDTPFKNITSTTESSFCDPDYLLIIILAIFMLSDGENGFKLF